MSMSIMGHIAAARNELNEAEAKLNALVRDHGAPAPRVAAKPWRPQFSKVSAPPKAKPGPKAGARRKSGDEGPKAYWLRVLGDGLWHKSTPLVEGRATRSTTLYHMIKSKQAEIRGGRGPNREVRLVRPKGSP